MLVTERRCELSVLLEPDDSLLEFYPMPETFSGLKRGDTRQWSIVEPGGHIGSNLRSRGARKGKRQTGQECIQHIQMYTPPTAIQTGSVLRTADSRSVRENGFGRNCS